MPLASAYHRPRSIHEAVELLSGENRVALAGGTIVNADREHAGIEVVDLQSARGMPGGVSFSTDRIIMGAMNRLSFLLVQDEKTFDALPAPMGDQLRAIVRAELPSTLRTLATVGGTVAAMQSDSVLAAAFLAADGKAEVFDGAGSTVVPLADLFRNGVAKGSIVTSVDIARNDQLAVAGTGRTPADTPIVAAVAHRLGDTVRVALTGVAATPILVNPEDPTAGLAPPDDFRGSADYRRHLAATLTGRVLDVVS